MTKGQRRTKLPFDSGLLYFLLLQRAKPVVKEIVQRCVTDPKHKVEGKYDSTVSTGQHRVTFRVRIMYHGTDAWLRSPYDHLAGSTYYYAETGKDGDPGPSNRSKSGKNNV